MNILPDTTNVKKISDLLTIIGQPVRIQILFIIQKQEACVCHLEAVLGIRQASISQHLMALRKAGLVYSEREGRNVYYHITNPDMIATLFKIADLIDVQPESLNVLATRPYPNCPCPQCNPENESDYSCQNLHPVSIESK